MEKTFNTNSGRKKTFSWYFGQREASAGLSGAEYLQKVFHIQSTSADYLWRRPITEFWSQKTLSWSFGQREASAGLTDAEYLQKVYHRQSSFSRYSNAGYLQEVFHKRKTFSRYSRRRKTIGLLDVEDLQHDTQETFSRTSRRRTFFKQKTLLRLLETGGCLHA